jgi:hypothetical protein
VTSPAVDRRVTTLELFFDLVFVFTITQLTSLLVRDLTIAGVLQMVLVFGNVWWMYGGYAWLTNAVPPRDPVMRLLLLVGMGGYLIVALAIPTVFGSGGVAFGVGYLLVTLVHTGLFLRASQESVVRAVTRLGPFNIITAALLLVAGFTNGPTRLVLFAADFTLAGGLRLMFDKADMIPASTLAGPLHRGRPGSASPSSAGDQPMWMPSTPSWWRRERPATGSRGTRSGGSVTQMLRDPDGNGIDLYAASP